MKRSVQILGGLLVAQVALAAVTWGTRGRTGGDDSRALLDLDAKAITALGVELPPDPTKPTAAGPLRLKKVGEGWVVASADDYPAKTDKVEELVGKLAGLKVREPVATQALSHSGLKVADTGFDKKVVLEAGGQSHTLLVGGAKGTSVHVRKAGEDAVYLGRGISAWAISDRTSTYVDTQYVKVEDPSRILVKNPAGTLTLVKNDAAVWQVAELPPEVKLDEGRVNAFVSAARSLQLTEPVGRTVKPEYGLDTGTTVELGAGDKVTRYTVGAKVGSDHYLKAEGNDYVVKVSQFSVESLLTQTPDKFLPEAPAPGGEQGMPPGMGLPPGMGMPPGMGLPPGMGMPGGH